MEKNDNRDNEMELSEIIDKEVKKAIQEKVLPMQTKYEIQVKELSDALIGVKELMDDILKGVDVNITKKQSPSITNINNLKIGMMFRDAELDFNNYKVKSKVGEILDNQGKTQTWLSSKTGIPKSTIYAIINNTNSISLENAYKISLVLNIPLERVFPFNNSENEK